MLVAEGRITRAELDAALSYRQERGMKLGQALVALNLVTQADLAAVLRAQGKVHCIHLTPGMVSRKIAALLGEERSRRFQAIAINEIAGVITVAMEDPSETTDVDAISLQLNSPVLAVHAEPGQIEACLDHVFERDAAPERASAAMTLDSALDGAEPEAPLRRTAARAATRSATSDADEHAIDAVRALLDDAIAHNASSIHVEPRAGQVDVRFRIDGVLCDRPPLPRAWAEAVATRLKVLGNLDVQEHRLPQSGRARAEIGGRELELSFAMLPTAAGESCVIRVHDTRREACDLAGLDLSAADGERVSQMIAGSGLVLVCGPVHSGKKATLRVLIQRVDSPRRKIVSVESAITGELPHATQIAVDERIGLTFARGLRAAAEHDPDVVLVSDLRDAETALAVLRAAQSGCLVISSMCTTTAADAIARLREAGLPAETLADAIRGIIAQRWVRKICATCRRPASVRAELRDALCASANDAFYEGAGCRACHGTGFDGRVLLSEIVGLTPELRALVRAESDAAVLREAMRAAGMTLLGASGLRRARSGLTTLDEVRAATTAA
jgi:type II secretory ATPase GspE/PulE/Tfp pilus assembly ATPase PilB-like protein